MEIYIGITEEVPGPVKRERYVVTMGWILTPPPCEGMIIDPANELGSSASRRQRERSWIS